MKKLRAVLVVSILILGVMVIPSKRVQAADVGECIDGSYLIDENNSEREDTKITRGMYLKSGTSSITEVGTGKIVASGKISKWKLASLYDLVSYKL